MANFLKAWSRQSKRDPNEAKQSHPFRSRWRRVGTWVTLVLVWGCIVLLISPMLDRHPDLPKPNSVWDGPNVLAPFDLLVQDDTDAEAALTDDSLAQKVFTYDPTAEVKAQAAVTALLKYAQEARSANQPPAAFHREVINRGLAIRRDTAEVLIREANNQRTGVDLSALLRQLFVMRGITADKPLLEDAAAHKRLSIGGMLNQTTSGPVVAKVLAFPGEAAEFIRGPLVESLELSPLVRQAYADIVTQLVRPNISFDHDATLAQRKALAASLVKTVPLEKDAVIAKPGDVITRFQAAAFAAIYQSQLANTLMRITSNAMLAALLMVFMIQYTRSYRKTLTATSRNVLMVGIPVLLALAAGRFAYHLNGSNPVLAFLFPAGMVAMLGTILFGSRFALILTTLSSLLLGILTDYSLQWTLIALLGGWTAIGGLYNIRERREVLMAGVRLSLINCIVITAVGLSVVPTVLGVQAYFAAVLNGLACYVLTIGMLPIFETLFGITTDVRLMELTSTNHPLLKQLQERAPGTFQHVLSVTKLAEQAADAVGANFLLVRAGAYFHDTGKMVKPKYFTENQVTPEERRIHSKLTPYMSTLIIKNHVKQGMEIAKKHHLPQKVVDFIPQHHGTSLIKYFYMQAKERSDLGEFPEDEFRYPGPRPQTREAAIVMIADSVEASATAKLTKPVITEDDVRKLVLDTVMEKFSDRQFDEANMTMRDLHKITESFISSLLGRYHHRIDYPTPEKRETRDVTYTEPRVEAPVSVGR